MPLWSMTTRVLMAAVSRGVGRETAHEVIKQHAVAAIRAWRSGDSVSNDLMDRLAGDQRLGLDGAELELLLREGEGETGAADQQVEAWLRRTKEVIGDDRAADYRPGSIL
jgi:adenylosuccinate lyase